MRDISTEVKKDIKTGSIIGLEMNKMQAQIVAI